MGFSHAVSLAQKCTVKLLLDSGVAAADLVLAGNRDFSLLRPRVVPYLDDVVVIGLTRHLRRVEAIQVAYVWLGMLRDWIFAIPKLKLPQHVLDVLGLVLNGLLGTYGPDPLKVVGVAEAAAALIRRRVVPARDLARVVGQLTWFGLCARQSLSSFNAVYFVNRNAKLYRRKSVEITAAVAYELRLMLGLLPLLSCNMAAPWHPDVVASDASEFGFGVTATTPAPWVVPEAALLHGPASLPPFASRDDLHPALQRVLDGRWRTILSSPVRHPTYIGSLEVVAATLALRWATSSPQAIGSRLLILSDSSVTVTALHKGRSSSQVSPYVRRFAAFCLAAAIRPTLVWIPTAVNPADAPSRLRQ